MSEKHQISVVKASRIENGSCNNCQGRKDELVFCISLKVIGIRLCGECRKELLENLIKCK